MVVDAVSTASTLPAPGASAAGASGSADDEDGLFDGLSFWDLLDVVNPLHHLPIVGPVYRHFSGDELKSGPRLAGGFLFGSWIGLAGSAFEVILQKTTGKDAGEHVFGLFEGEPDPVHPAIAGGARDHLHGEGWGTLNPDGPTVLFASGTARMTFPGIEVREADPEPRGPVPLGFRSPPGSGSGPQAAQDAAARQTSQVSQTSPVSPGAAVGGFSPLAMNVMAPPGSASGSPGSPVVRYARNASLPFPERGGPHPGGLPTASGGPVSGPSPAGLSLPGRSPEASVAIDPSRPAAALRMPGVREGERTAAARRGGEAPALPRSLTDGRTAMDLLELRMQGMAAPSPVRAPGAGLPDRRVAATAPGRPATSGHRPPGESPSSPSAPVVASGAGPSPDSPRAVSPARLSGGAVSPPVPVSPDEEPDSAIWALQKMMRNLDTYRRAQSAGSGKPVINTDV